MVELVDTLVLETSAIARVGASPTKGTNCSLSSVGLERLATNQEGGSSSLSASANAPFV